MTDPAATALLELGWSHLSRGVSDRRHPARYPVLATQGPDGPELRTLVLRSASRAQATLELHTDAASPKVAQIRTEPRVALMVWLPKPRLQLRLKARAETLPGDPALFAALPPEARANYAGAVPGSRLPATAPEGDGTDRFTRILCHLTEIDVLHLAPDGHVRARFRASDAWSGVLIAP